MALPKLSKLELQIMEALWTRGAASIREIQEAFPEPRVKKIGNAHIFEAVVTRSAAQGRLIDDLLAFFGGRARPVLLHFIESGKLTLDDVEEAEKILRRLTAG